MSSFIPQLTGLLDLPIDLLYFHCVSVIAVIQLSVMSDSATPGTAAHQASLSFTIPQSLLKLMSLSR